MTTRVVATPEAEEQVRTIEAWWRRERTAAPNLFTEELAAAFALLGGNPQVGRRYPHPTVPEIRRVLLRSSRHHVYYKPHEEQGGDTMPRTWAVHHARTWWDTMPRLRVVHHE